MKLRKRMVARNRNHEQGSDIITTLFMIPFVLGLIFVLVDVSSYFQTRSTVQNITRDGARQVALYGGNGTNVPLNSTQRTVAAAVYERLYADGSCQVSNCANPPVVTCGPQIARNINDDAFCRVTYYYQSVGGGLVQWLGFGDLLAAPIQIEESFKVETRY